MRHLVWLSGVLLALSCTVNNDNLDVDAGGTGGNHSFPADGGQASGGTPGGSPTGGTGGGTATATGGTSGVGGGGPPTSGTGGSATGGSGGALATGGTGGTTATGGAGGARATCGTGGATATGGTGGVATGGRAGTGGGGAAGRSGQGGQGGTTSCAALETAYMTALTQAEECTVGAADQCQELVERSLSCPGCKAYVDDATTLQTLANAWTDQDCGASSTHVCPAIACLLPMAGHCVSSGTGLDHTGTCSAGSGALGTN